MIFLRFLYLFCNPYRHLRKFLEKRGEQDIHTYGETPLSTLRQILSEAEITPQDHYLELGSGRGFTCLFISEKVGCRVTGVDYVPRFTSWANLTAFLYSLPARFLNTDLTNAPFHDATIVYLYGTCLPDTTISALEQKMHTLPKGARIISVSFPLNLPLKKSFPVSYPFGETTAYLHVIQ